MKFIKNSLKILSVSSFVFLGMACNDLLDEPAENKSYASATDYTKSENITSPILGLYSSLYDFGWERYPLLAVRGDDVNAGGLGDQQDFGATDNFSYNKDFWMYNSVWENLYNPVLISHSTVDEIEKYRANGASDQIANQYIGEAKVIRCFLLLQLSRTWGDIFIPASFDPTLIMAQTVSKKDSVMAYISRQMGEAIPVLPDLRPNQRTDLPGGVTKHTALAIKALADLELKDYQSVAASTSQIIESGKFTLESDYYNLFNIKGKLDNENLLEFQYSDFGKGEGTETRYPYDFFYPQGWSPKVEGSNGGWGFWEPSMKYIKFMLDRGETTRLETSVIFTNRGIEEIKKDSKYSVLPSWISNTSRSGDVFNDFARALFCSGKHILPSDQLTLGRKECGSNKNMICIRYAEVLLMYAEALTQGASASSSMTAVQAVNLVRARAGISPLSSVTNDQVMDEKYAELAMEWGTRFSDMVRLQRYNDLSYDGRTFDESKTFLPYPQAQIDLLPQLKDAGN